MSDLLSDGIRSLENADFQKCPVCQKIAPLLIDNECLTCYTHHERDKVLDELQTKIDDEQRKQMAACLQSRKQGYAAMPKRTVSWEIVEKWMKELRQQEQRGKQG